MQNVTQNDVHCIITELSLQLKNKSLHYSGSIQPVAGVVQAVSLSCDINTGKNQSDSTNCLKCLRMDVISAQ